ncbi:hypothetical protein [Pantoea endophytica]|uniref:hypothetical protein n=1 Tax=Pantoea endophytica TaxID=92488 RepID=UPI002413B944|nr:hypothetical protein [Pantoea endophytica]
MTNQKSNKEMVAASHLFAKSIGADTPLLEIAKLVSDLATRLDVITVLSDVLTAENLALKDYIDGECYVESKRTGVYTCAGINKPETPATDAILSNVHAEGVEMFAAHQRAMIGKPLKNDAATSYAAGCAVEYAAQLRAGRTEGGV